MIVELGVGIFTVGALGYATYWYRKRVKLARMPRRARIREEQVKRLKWLGDRIDSLWNNVHREELRLKRLKKRAEGEKS